MSAVELDPPSSPASGSWPGTVLVVGAGTMGRGIAQVVAEAGIPTRLFDVDPAGLRRAHQAIEDAWARAAAKGRATEADVERHRGNLEPATDLDAAAAVDLVIEAVFEQLQTKLDLFRQLSLLARPESILASNTSSISITRLAAAVADPGRVVGLHFFNPVPLLPLVEVVRGRRTTGATVERAAAFAERIGKTPIVVDDAPGFVVNRLLVPMINEAVFALTEGVAPAESIDAALKLGANHPMGPLALADLIGLDVCLDIMETLHRDFGDDKYRPAPLLRRMVAAGQLGRKSGEGFYRYGS